MKPKFRIKIQVEVSTGFVTFSNQFRLSDKQAKTWGVPPNLDEVFKLEADKPETIAELLKEIGMDSQKRLEAIHAATGRYDDLAYLAMDKHDAAWFVKCAGLWMEM